MPNASAKTTANDPTLESFVASAKGSDFPVQSLPYGVFRLGPAGTPRVGVAIGDQILDLAALEAAGLVRPAGDRAVFAAPALNAFMALGPRAWRETRQQLSELLRSTTPRLRDDAALRASALVRMADAELLLPVAIPAFTDFYSSERHASNVGALFRDKTNPLLPNWKHLPVAYNGRASTVVVSGTPVTRPKGQLKPSPEGPPVFGASQKLDFELEVGFYIGVGNAHGAAIPVETAAAHIFGMTLVNDWSARDHQAWEYVPLGPFLSKSFATTVAPWVVPMEALAPFKVAMPEQTPRPLPYLAEPDRHTYDVRLAVDLATARTPAAQTIAETNLREVYWSMAQQLAHHAVNGCRMDVGDLLATGTISGDGRDQLGSLLEMTLNGREPLALAGGETRTFLADGDELTLRGYCQGQGYRIGFGKATGRIVAARDDAR